MNGTVYCPACGAKVCEMTKSKDLKVKCRKCKNDILIDKEDVELRIKIIDRDLTITAEAK